MLQPHLKRMFFLATLVLLPALGSTPVLSVQASPHASETKPCVILLHGLWRSALSMKHLQWGLEKAGYPVVNEGYPSATLPIQQLASIGVEAGLAGCVEFGQGEQVAFVTHSLGGILVREYLSEREIEGLRRVVMLGPPNGGSQMAEFAESAALLKPFMPEAVTQLGTSEESVPRQLGPVSFELGVIAGTVNYLPFLPGQPEGPSDGTVAVAETIVPGMADFIEMPVGHSFMMWDNDVLAQVIYFLEHGLFERHSPPFISR
jgi:triacylglycerol lipase